MGRQFLAEACWIDEPGHAAGFSCFSDFTEDLYVDYLYEGNSVDGYSGHVKGHHNDSHFHSGGTWGDEVATEENIHVPAFDEPLGTAATASPTAVVTKDSTSTTSTADPADGEPHFSETSDSETGYETSPSGVPAGGHVDPITGHVYAADGSLMGMLTENNHLYWPVDWGPNGPVEDSETPPDDDSNNTTPRTLEQILADYRTHAEHRARLEQSVNNPDLSPAMRQHYTDQIVTQNNILADIAAQALAAGATQQQLDDIDQQANADSGSQMATDSDGNAADGSTGNQPIPLGFDVSWGYLFGYPNPADVLNGIPYIDPGTLPTTAVDESYYYQGGNVYWSGTLQGPQLVGPYGCGPCVGVTLVPRGGNGNTYSFHIGPYAKTTIIPQALSANGDLFPRGRQHGQIVGGDVSGLLAKPRFAAYLNGGGGPEGAENLQRVIGALNQLGINIIGYVPRPAVAIDANGNLYLIPSGTGNSEYYQP